MKLAVVVCILFNFLIKREIGKLGCHSHSVSGPSSSKLVIVTLNDANGGDSAENDTSKYTVEEDASQLKYKFGAGAKCVELKYDGVAVWNHDSTKGAADYPVEVALNQHASSLKIKTNSTLYIYAYRNSSWDLTFESAVVSCGDSSTAAAASAPRNAKLAPALNLVKSTFSPKSDAKPVSSATTSPAALHSKVSVSGGDAGADASADKSADSRPVSAAAQNAITLGHSSDPFVRRLFDLGVEITTVDARFRLRVNDLAHFRVMQENDTTLYQLVNFRDFCELKYRGEVLWKDRSSRKGASCPNFIFINQKNHVVRFNLVGGYSLWTDLRNQIRRYFNQYLINLGSRPPNGASNFQTMVFSLKIRDKSASGPFKSGITNKTIQHNLPGLLKHQLKPNEQCLEISFKSKPVWKHSPKIDKETYPTEVHIDFGPIIQVKVKFASRLHVYSYLSDKWVFGALSIDDFAASEPSTESLNPPVPTV